MPAVEVNLDVNADASGTVSVFGQAKASITNPVIASVNLTAKDLYDASATSSKALFQFQEPTNRTSREGKVITGFNTDSTILSGHLNAILCAGTAASLDASGAAPFNASAYSGNDDYQKYTSFGELVLAMYAHDLFGHVAGTGAIDNDDTLVAAIDNNAEGSGNSRLGYNLATAIYGMNTTAATAVVNQVLGQDAGRAMDQDNNLLAPDTWQDLKWYANDIIYVSVTVKQPIVSVSGTTADQNAQLGEPSATSVTQRTYMVKITLTA